MIRKLDYNLINKIAAGEVVERPLSAVKELVENAVDAGASVITVEIRDGGLAQIRVTDNGGGIPADELSLAFARHATSKIASAEDLYAVTTLGFRGEALSSIAAVAQVEVITKTHGSAAGARMEIHGGQEILKQEIGCADGTTFIVSNLFYNTPARRKFIKRPASEAALIHDMMQKLALGNPGLTFRYINNGETQLQTNGGGDLKTAVHYVYGKEISSKLIHVSLDENGYSLEGYVGRPEIARGSRAYQHFYICGRYVQSRLPRLAVETAMKTLLTGGKFPVFILALTVPPSEVDVNVHPNKLDVRFADEQGVYDFILRAVRDALDNSVLIPETTFKRKAPPPDLYETVELNGKTPPPERDKSVGDNKQIVDNADGNADGSTLVEDFKTFETLISTEDNKRDEDFGALETHSLTENNKQDKALNNDLTPGRQSTAEPASHMLVFKEERGPVREETPFFSDYRILGLLFKTYWLIAQRDSLYVIDQHAAHERVLYEEILTNIKQSTVHAQPLLEPLRPRLTAREAERLRENADFFERAGFEIEDDGGRFEIRAVPFILRGPLPAAFFTELLDKLDEPARTADIAEHRAHVIATMACKAAVKANDSLTEAEARALIVKMLALKQPFTCPHGRPTVIEITRREIERKFKR